MGRRERLNIIVSIVAAVGIILILGTLWYVGKENRFKKYENKAKGFSIKYPASWSMEENKNGAEVIFFSPVENDLDIFKESVNIVIQDISGNPMGLSEYSKLAIEQMEAVFEENLLTIESEPTYFANQSAYKYVFIGKGPETDMQYKSVWLIRGLKAYQVTYTALASQYERFLPKVNKMFKSFRLD